MKLNRTKTNFNMHRKHTKRRVCCTRVVETQIAVRTRKSQTKIVPDKEGETNGVAFVPSTVLVVSLPCPPRRRIDRQHINHNILTTNENISPPPATDKLI